MAHPNFTKPFYVHVDASKGGLGAMLTQLDDKGHHQVIEYASFFLRIKHQVPFIRVKKTISRMEKRGEKRGGGGEIN